MNVDLPTHGEEDLVAPSHRRPEPPFFRRVEHPPFEPQKANRTPDGWVVEPIGRWAGHETEVVYDPRLHAVMLVTETRGDADLERGLAASGWQRRGGDGSRTLWLRDKLAATRAALTRLEDPPAGVGLEAAPAAGGRATPIGDAGVKALAPSVPGHAARAAGGDGAAGAMSVSHRQTAAGWHGGQWSALYAFASAGVVLRGIDEEVRDCLATVERGELGDDLDAVEEHERLRALLHHVEPELAADEARLLAADHARNAVAWWHQEVLGARAPGDRSAVARRILLGIEDGDPAVLDTLPEPSSDYAPGELAADCGWPEPDADDRQAHDRWAGAQAGIQDAYTIAFADEVRKQVAYYCDDLLAEAAVDPPRPYVRPVAGQGREQERADLRIPAGSIVEILGSWGGSQSEVVYDPRRFEVFATPGRIDTTVEATLESSGWERLAGDGQRDVWIRDRVAAARAALDPPAAADIGRTQAPGLEL